MKIKITRMCEFCGKEITKPRFCSRKCSGHFEVKTHVERGEGVSHHTLRMLLIALRGHKCEECKLEIWKNESIPLETHHIDGDYNNNNLENLKLTCPNCHALTDNYKAKNKGNGRPYNKYR